MAQWKRAGPITQRSKDRNLALLAFFFLAASKNNISRNVVETALSGLRNKEETASIENMPVTFALKVTFFFLPQRCKSNFEKFQETHATKMGNMCYIYFIPFLAPPLRQGSEKLLSRLIISFPSTEIFSKRRKIYAF